MKNLMNKIDQLKFQSKIDMKDEIELMTNLICKPDVLYDFFCNVMYLVDGVSISFYDNIFFKDNTIQSYYLRTKELFLEDKEISIQSFKKFIENLNTKDSNKILCLIDDTVVSDSNLDFLFKKICFRNEKIKGLKIIEDFVTDLVESVSFITPLFDRYFDKKYEEIFESYIEGYNIRVLSENICVKRSIHLIKSKKYSSNLNLLLCKDQAHHSSLLKNVVQLLLLEDSNRNIFLSKSMKINELKSIVSDINDWPIPNIELNSEFNFYPESNYNSRSIFRTFIYRQCLFGAKALLIDDVSIFNFFDDYSSDLNVLNELQKIATEYQITFILIDFKISINSFDKTSFTIFDEDYFA